MGFFSLLVRGQTLTQTLSRHQTRGPNTGTYVADYLTRSVRRASGFVLTVLSKARQSMVHAHSFSNARFAG
jgi:hypothetical protein